MHINSIEKAVRKAVKEAGDSLVGEDIEKIVKEVCEAGSCRVSLNLPTVIANTDEPWLHITAGQTFDGMYEIYVIVDLLGAKGSKNEAKVYQGVFSREARKLMSITERTLTIRPEENQVFVGGSSLREYAKHLLRPFPPEAHRDTELLAMVGSLRESVDRRVSIMPELDFAATTSDDSIETECLVSDIFDSPKHVHSFGLTAPPDLAELILDGKAAVAEGRFNESIDRQLIWEMGGDMEKVAEIKGVCLNFGGLLSHPKGTIARYNNGKTAAISEGRSYALNHLAEIIKKLQINKLSVSNPVWGTW